MSHYIYMCTLVYKTHKKGLEMGLRENLTSRFFPNRFLCRLGFRVGFLYRLGFMVRVRSVISVSFKVQCLGLEMRFSQRPLGVFVLHGNYSEPWSCINEQYMLILYQLKCID